MAGPYKIVVIWMLLTAVFWWLLDDAQLQVEWWVPPLHACLMSVVLVVIALSVFDEFQIIEEKHHDT